MGRRTQIRVGDALLDVTEEDFEIKTQGWNEYRLLDGGTVRILTTVQRIYRVLDAKGNPKHDEQGDPEMIVRHTAQVVAREE